MAERLIAPVLKTGRPSRVSGVRIPLSPPFCYVHGITFKAIFTSVIILAFYGVVAHR